MSITNRLKVLLFTLIGFLVPSLGTAEAVSAEKCVMVLYDYTPPIQFLDSPALIDYYYKLSRQERFELKEDFRTYRLSREIGQGVWNIFRGIGEDVRASLDRRGEQRDQEIAAINMRWSGGDIPELEVGKNSLEVRLRFVMAQLKKAGSESLISRLTRSKVKLEVEPLLKVLSANDLGKLLETYVSDYTNVLKAKKIDYVMMATASEWKDAPEFLRVVDEWIRRSKDESMGAEAKRALDKAIHILYGTHSDALVASTANPSQSIPVDRMPYVENSLSTQIVQKFAEARSPSIAKILELHFLHVNPSKALEEKQALFIKAGLDIDNVQVVAALTKMGGSIFEGPRTMVAIAALRVDGKLIWAKSPADYFHQKYSILDKELERLESSGKIDEIRKQRAIVSRAARVHSEWLYVLYREW